MARMRSLDDQLSDASQRLNRSAGKAEETLHSESDCFAASAIYTNTQPMQ